MPEKRPHAWVVECRKCRESNGYGDLRREDCALGGEPGRIIVCPRCGHRALHGRSKIKPLEFYLGGIGGAGPLTTVRVRLCDALHPGLQGTTARPPRDCPI
jgi:hypothetical protein